MTSGNAKYVIEPHDRRHARGAFFTPPEISDYLCSWAIRDKDARVLDPTCGEAVFLLSAGRTLQGLGCDTADLDTRLFGIDIHAASLETASSLLEAENLDAHLVESDFFLVAPDEVGAGGVPKVDAVVGNPPFVRYQKHKGAGRENAVKAALAQGVRLSGLASSWAAALVHSAGFLRDSGRLAMVLPSELLTVQYAEPVRNWLMRRFASVTLVVFEKLQFEDATENTLLLLARGGGGCESFNLVYVEDASDLADMKLGDGVTVTPSVASKWTELLLPLDQRKAFHLARERFGCLNDFGAPTLGTVTGANEYFAVSESQRAALNLDERHLVRISPPGTRHFRGLRFSAADWRRLRDSDERVWLFCPDVSSAETDEVALYVAQGEQLGVQDAYKCKIRNPWWRPPVVDPPDLFFTYMSHRFPRLIRNSAGVSFLNSMHGVRLNAEHALCADALPLVAMNSVTMLGAEVFGRSYGGGILKMEPREAALLPMPHPDHVLEVWAILELERGRLEQALSRGLWTNVLKRVDEVLLAEVMKLDRDTIERIQAAAVLLRERRTRS